MCELLIRLEDKRDSSDRLVFRKFDVVDIFEDGKFAGKQSWPHAIIKVPGGKREAFLGLMESHNIDVAGETIPLLLRKRRLDETGLKMLYVLENLFDVREVTLKPEAFNQNIIFNRVSELFETVSEING